MLPWLEDVQAISCYPIAPQFQRSAFQEARLLRYHRMYLPPDSSPHSRGDFFVLLLRACLLLEQQPPLCRAVNDPSELRFPAQAPTLRGSLRPTGLRPEKRLTPGPSPSQGEGRTGFRPLAG